MNNSKNFDMTNEELLAKIRAEIERRIKECEATYPKDKDGYWFPEQEEAHAIAEEYKQHLSFLTTLEEQQKEVSNSIIDVDFNKFEELFDDFCKRSKGHHITSHDACMWFWELGLNARKKEHKSNPIFDECVAKVDQKVREEVSRNIELKKEIEKKYDQAKWGYVDGFGAVVMDKGQFIRIARHFAQWGAENLKK